MGIKQISGFNGAAPMKARKRATPTGHYREEAVLQWGRADEGAETATMPPQPEAEEDASMGPRR